MNDEPTNGISDPVVSETYRDAATERAPASLNEAVLRNAAAHAEQGYAHSMLWMARSSNSRGWPGSLSWDSPGVRG